MYVNLAHAISYRLGQLKDTAFYSAYFAPWSDENRNIKITYLICMPVLYICLAWNYSVIDQKGLIATLLAVEVLATSWFGSYIGILEQCLNLARKTVVEGGPDTKERAENFRRLRRRLTNYTYSTTALNVLPCAVFILLCRAMPDETSTREHITAYVLAFVHSLALGLWNISQFVRDVYTHIRVARRPVNGMVKLDSDDYIYISMQMIEKAMYKSLDKNP